jgi:hypothetical protein
MKSLDLDKLNSKPHTIISSEEALKNIIPIDWFGIDKDTHVYCAKCVHGEILFKGIYNDDCLITPCYFCDGFDPENSKPFKERPYYVPE